MQMHRYSTASPILPPIHSELFAGKAPLRNVREHQAGHLNRARIEGLLVRQPTTYPTNQSGI